VNPQDLLARLNELRQTLTTRQIVTLGLAFAAAVVLVAGSAYWLNAPDYRLLVADMEPDEAARIETVLQNEKVNYRLTDGGRSVEVPKDQVDRLRLRITSSGLPSSGRIGFEIFDRTAFGQTEFLEQVNYRRALEGEIARTIGTISEVRDARVHIAMAKDSLFESRSQPAKASITLTLKRNRPLPASTVSGIVNLVAASVEGLRPEAIVLIDSYGRPLSKPNADGDDEPLSGSGLERQQRLEKEYSARVVGMLEPIVGAERVRVNVSLRLNSSTQEETQERYDPNSVIRSRQLSTEGSTAPNAQGVAGARGNLPGTTPPAAAGAAVTPTPPPAPSLSTSAANRSSETTNFEIGKTVVHRVTPRGDIERLSVAVVVDDNHVVKTETDGRVTRTTKPRAPAEMQKIQQIVAAAVGLDTQRGDQITVENVAFDDTVEPATPPTLMERLGPGLRDYGSIVAVLILGLAALMFVVRPIVKGVVKPAKVALPGAVAGPGGLESLPAPVKGALPRTIEEIDSEIEAQLDAQHTDAMADRKTPVLQRRVTKIVQDEPENAARLVRSWLVEDKA
jgi:flagellar M-ring protein FliF